MEKSVKKRAIKSPLDLRAEAEQIENKKFLDEYKELIEPLNMKYFRRLVPIMNYTEQGAFPVFGIQKIIKEEVTVQPANEKREEPETN